MAKAATRKRATSTSTAKVSAEKVASQNAIYAPPWLLLLLVAAVGQVAHVLWGDHLLGRVGILGCTTIVAVTGWAGSGERTMRGRCYALVTIVVAGLWLALASTTGIVELQPVGPFTLPVPQRPTFDLWVLVGFSVAFAWNQRQGVRLTEAAAAELRGDLDEWDGIGLPGLRVTDRKRTAVRVEVDFVLPKGITLEDLQRRAREVEQVKGWPRKSLTLTEHQSRHSRKARGVVMLSDPLAEPVAWPGLTSGKRTLLDPIPVGVYADGTTATQHIAKRDGTKHTLVQGMTGSGKSEGEFPVLLECADRGAVQWVIDTRKKTQTYGRVAPVLDWLIVDQGTARAVLKRLAEHIIPARTDALAAEGLTQWSPKSKLRLLRVQIEEAWSVVEADELMEIAVSARSAGVQIVVSLQRASHDQINTTVREQLGCRKCYGLGGDFGVSVLDDDVVDAGADPTRWKDQQPGMAYLDEGGLALDQKITPLRAYSDHDTGARLSYQRVAVALGDKVAALDEVTVRAAGELYARRTAATELVAQARGRGAATSERDDARDETATSERDHTATGSDTEDDDMTATHNPDGSVTFGTGPDAETLTFTDPDPEPGHIPDPDEPISDRPDEREQLRFGREPKDGPAEFRAKMDAQLTELLDERRELITAADFAQVVVDSGWSRASTYTVLAEWVDAGRLARTDDGWIPTAP